MTDIIGSRIKRLWRLALPLCAGMVWALSPAQAQMSDSYKFLDAVKKKDGEKVEKVISEPGSTLINARDVSSGEGALHIVTQRRDLTWLRFLVAKGAHVDMRDDKGVTPLQLATNLGWLEGVSFLVSRNANLDESDDTGETPLISAVHRKNVAMMRTLLNGGADPDRADNSGRSARDYARLAGSESRLLETINTLAKPKSKDKSATVYGPTF